jgi:hypothetical protein
MVARRGRRQQACEVDFFFFEAEVLKLGPFGETLVFLHSLVF